MPMKNAYWIWICIIVIVAALAYFFWPKGIASAPGASVPAATTNAQ